MVSLTLEISRILQVDYSRNNYVKQAAIPSGVAATPGISARCVEEMGINNG